MKKYLAQMASFSPALKWAILSEVIYELGIGMFILLFNLHIVALGYDANVIGSLLAAGFAVTAVMLIPVGRYADVIGRRFIFLVGNVMVVAGIALIGLFRGLPFLFAGEILYSLGAAVVLSTWLPIVLSLCKSQEEETFTYSMVTSISVFSTGLGSILGGFIPLMLPGVGEALYRPTLLLGVMFILVALIARVFLPVPPLRQEAGGQKMVLSWFPSREVLKFIGYAGIVGLGFAFTIPFYNLMLQMEYGLNSEMIGIIIGIHQFITFTGMFLVPFIESKWGRDLAFAAVVVVGIAGNLIMGFTPHVILFVSLLFVYTFVYPMIFSVVERHALSVTRDVERSQHVAYRTVFRQISFLIGGKLGGFLIAANLTFWNFYLTAIVLLVLWLYYQGVVRSIFVSREKNVEVNIEANA